MDIFRSLSATLLALSMLCVISPYPSYPFFKFLLIQKKNQTIILNTRCLRKDLRDTMSTKYKIISFGIKPTRSLTLVPIGRLMSIHVKYNGYGYMLSLLFG